ncbi:MAG: alanyl-tRNA editing protein [Lachnospiraceae bacterium]|nr:alanyl-tRNA editing protein [Lachnospiraceae bacterium]
METIKLYDQDAYASSFEAQVLSCEQTEYKKKKAYAVVLEQTLFFPEEGGQSADTGSLNGKKVLDVRIKENVITHYLEDALAAGEKVTGVIDFPARFDKMQQHTAEHIFSGLVKKHFGFANVGFRLSALETTMDYDGFLSPEDIRLLEAKANEAIWKNKEVHAWYPDPGTLSKMDYRSKIALTGGVRIVEIPEVDLCACCAPHVARTGEIGILKIVDAIHYKQGMRLTLLAGGRALQDYSLKHQSNTEISHLLSAKPYETLPAVKSQMTEAEKQKQASAELEKKYIALLLEKIQPTDQNLILFEDRLGNIALRELANGLKEKTKGFCLVLSGEEDKGYKYILTAGGKEVLQANQQLKEAFGARGGGSKEMTQGSLQAGRKELEAWFSSIV